MARTSKKASAGKAIAQAIAPKDRIVDALMALAAEERFDEITLNAIAERANVTLGEFRELFSSKAAVLAAFVRRIDKVVLDGTTADMADETSKERLFDVLMRRFDAMAPYKPGLEGIAEWARREPLAAAGLNRLGVNSMRFMMEAAGVETNGRIGALKAQGLAIAWARLVGVWLDDEDPGLSATMAELDRTLTRGDNLVARAKDIERLTAPLRMIARTAIGAGLRYARDRRAKSGDAETAAED